MLPCLKKILQYPTAVALDAAALLLEDIRLLQVQQIGVLPLALKSVEYTGIFSSGAKHT